MELQAMRPGDWPAWDAAHLPGHRLVARVDGQVVGWTTLAPVSDRCAYAGVAGVRERLGRLRGR